MRTNWSIFIKEEGNEYETEEARAYGFIKFMFYNEPETMKDFKKDADMQKVKDEKEEEEYLERQNYN